MPGPLGILDEAASRGTGSAATEPQTSDTTTAAPAEPVAAPTAQLRQQEIQPADFADRETPTNTLEQLSATLQEIRTELPVSENRSRAARKKRADIDRALGRDRDPVRRAVEEATENTLGDLLVASGPDVDQLSPAMNKMSAAMANRLRRMSSIMQNFKKADGE